jgi:hypothetical protein
MEKAADQCIDVDLNARVTCQRRRKRRRLRQEIRV